MDAAAVPGPVAQPLPDDRATDVLAGYRTASGRVLDKVIHHLDAHCREFIAHSPFATLATADADGCPDISPRGGDPGFVHVLDEHRLAPAAERAEALRLTSPTSLAALVARRRLEQEVAAVRQGDLERRGRLAGRDRP